jgi:putative NADH-flavin reductase
LVTKATGRVKSIHNRIAQRFLREGLLLGSMILLAGLFNSNTALAHNPGESSGVRILVIGATSRTANELIPQALWRGHQVIAFARRPHRVRIAAHQRLKIIKGDVYERTTIEAALSGQGDEVVITLIGPRTEPGTEVPEMDLMSTGTTNIIEAMKIKGNNRLFAASSTAVQTVAKLGYKADTPRPEGLNETNGLWYYFMRGPYNDMIKMEGIVRNSGLDFIILRPGQMLVQPAYGNIKLAVDSETPKQPLITYADFAAFILDQVESEKYLGTTVGVYSDRKMEFGKNVDLAAEEAKRMESYQQLQMDLAAESQ